jgi:hypothetical protein
VGSAETCWCNVAELDELVFSHTGRGHAGADDAQLDEQVEAFRSWGRAEFLRPQCLAPGGLLYMTAADSFGALTPDKLYIFPHFGPIQAEHFRYNAEKDCLVPDDAEASSFVQHASFNAPAARPSPGWGGGGGSTGGSIGGGGGSTAAAADEMSAADRRQQTNEARLKRFEGA